MGTARRTAASVVATAALAGCALISGAGDLTVGPTDDGGAAETSSGGDGATTPDGTMPGADGSVGPIDGSTIDAKKPGDGGDGGTRLREVTFEDGTLLGIHGGDSMFGNNVFLATGLSALAGNDSMRVDKGIAGVQVDIAPVDELYATCLVKFENLDLSSSTAFVIVPEPGGVAAELQVEGKDGPFQLVIGGTAMATGGMAKQGTAFYVGFHVRQDLSSSLVEVFVTDTGVPFGGPIMTATVPRLGRTAGVRMGVLAGGGNTRAVFDDLLLDSASLPVP